MLKKVNSEKKISQQRNLDKGKENNKFKVVPQNYTKETFGKKQTFAVWSWEPVATNLSFSDMSTELINLSWALAVQYGDKSNFRAIRGLSSGIFHSFKVVSWEPEANINDFPLKQKIHKISILK